MEFNNAELEKTISVVWANFIDALVQEVKQQGIGKAQTPQDLFVPVLQATIAKTDVRPALSAASPAHEKELKKTLERVLTNVMMEICDEHPENDYLETLYQLVATTTKLDDLYARYYASEDTRKIVLGFINEINTIISTFEKSSEEASKRAEELRTMFNALEKKFSSETSSGITSDSNDLYQSLSAIDDIFVAENPDTSFELLKRCVASIRYALDLVQLKYQGSRKEEQVEVKGAYLRFFKTGSVIPSKAEAISAINNYKKAYKLLFSRLPELDWCTCPAAPFEIRVALIIRVGQDAKQRFAGYRGRLVYTSIGSGSHLQDYLIIQELRAQGFNFLDINLMELDTRDIKEIHAMIDHPQSDIQRIHAEHLLDAALNQAVLTAILVKKLGAFMWHAGTMKDRPRAKDRGIYVTLYQNARDYIDFALQYPAFKAHILVLVDPSGAVFTTHDIRQANAILMVPRYEPEISSEEEYKKEEEGEEALPDLTDTQFKNSLVLLLPRSAGIEAYTTIKKPYDVLYATFLQAVSDVLRQEKAATVYVPTLGSLLTSGRIQKELVPYLHKDFSYKSWLITNAYIAFHDIVINASQPTALLYQADCIDRECHSKLTAITDSKKYLAGSILPHELIKSWSPDFERWYPDIKLLTYESGKAA